MESGAGVFAPGRRRFDGLLPLVALVGATLVLASCSEDEFTAVGPTPVPDEDQPPAWVLAPTVAAVLAPVTIDFTGIGLTGAGSPFGFVGQHSQAGFTLVDPANPTAFAFFLWRIGSGEFFTGTAALANASDGVSRLTQDNGAPFDFTSIDLGRFQGTAPATVDFTGVRADGTSVSATVTSGGVIVAGVLQLATFTPVGFTDILSLEWVSSPTAQFDNIVVVPQVAPPEPAPEPGPPSPAPGAGDATLEIRRASLDLKDRGAKHERKHGKKHKSDDRFSIVADFALSAGSDGIDVPNEEVEVTFGAFSVTIPAGSFKKIGKKGRKFTFHDSKLKIELRRNGRLKIDGKKLDLSSIDPTAPIDIGFRVGDDAGTATITLNRRGKFKR
jgi:hypothetical protein